MVSLLVLRLYTVWIFDSASSSLVYIVARIRIASTGTPSSNLTPMLAVVGLISQFGSLSFFWSTYGVAFAFPFTSFMQRRSSFYFLPSLWTIDTKAVKNYFARKLVQESFNCLVLKNQYKINLSERIGFFLAPLIGWIKKFFASLINKHSSCSLTDVMLFAP